MFTIESLPLICFSLKPKCVDIHTSLKFLWKLIKYDAHRGCSPSPLPLLWLLGK